MKNKKRIERLEVELGKLRARLEVAEAGLGLLRRVEALRRVDKYEPEQSPAHVTKFRVVANSIIKDKEEPTDGLLALSVPQVSR